MVTMDNRRRALLHVRRDLLLEASEDLYRFWAVSLDVLDALGQTAYEERREAVLQLVRDLLDKDLIVIGDLDERNGHVRPWGLSVEASLQRISQAWDAVADERTSEELAWFESTPTGDEWVKRYYALLSELDGRDAREMDTVEPP